MRTLIGLALVFMVGVAFGSLGHNRSPALPVEEPAACCCGGGSHGEEICGGGEPVSLVALAAKPRCKRCGTNCKCGAICRCPK